MMKLHVNMTRFLILCCTALVLSGCQTLSSKTDAYDNRSPSYLVYGYYQHLQGKQLFQNSWLDERQFTSRVQAHYESLPQALPPFSASKIRGAFPGIIGAVRGMANGKCQQIDASYEQDGLHVMVECFVDEGFIVQELLLDVSNENVSLVDLSSATNGVWMSELFSHLVADHTGIGRLNEVFSLIGESRAGQLDLAKYYALNGYIKTNRILALTFNTVHDNAVIRKELSEALEAMCPLDPDCALGRFDYYVETEQYLKAIEMLNLAKVRYPRSQYIQETLANLYLETNQHDLAVETGRQVIWTKPSAINGFMQVFSAAASMGDVEQATQAAAAMVKGFKVQPKDITNEYNQEMADIPGFWQRVNSIVAASKQKP